MTAAAPPPEFDATQPPWPVHPHEQGLPENARTLLRAILLLAPVRQQMQHLTQSDYLQTCYGLMAKGMLEVAEVPGGYQVRLTPLGWQWVGAQEVKH